MHQITIAGSAASASNSVTFPDGYTIALQQGFTFSAIILDTEYTVDSEVFTLGFENATAGATLGSAAGSVLTGFNRPAVNSIALGRDANADTDNQFVVGTAENITRVKTPGFAPESNSDSRYLQIDSDGNWQLASGGNVDVTSEFSSATDTEEKTLMNVRVDTDYHVQFDRTEDLEDLLISDINSVQRTTDSEDLNFEVSGNVAAADFILTTRDAEIHKMFLQNDDFTAIIDVQGVTPTRVFDINRTIFTYVFDDVVDVISGTFPAGDEIETEDNAHLYINPISNAGGLDAVTTDSLVNDIRNIDTPTTGQVLTATSDGLEFADAAGGGDTIYEDYDNLLDVNDSDNGTDFVADSTITNLQNGEFVLASNNFGGGDTTFYALYLRQTAVNDSELQNASVLQITHNNENGWFRIIRAENNNTGDNPPTDPICTILFIQPEPFQGEIDLSTLEHD